MIIEKAVKVTGGYRVNDGTFMPEGSTEILQWVEAGGIVQELSLQELKQMKMQELRDVVSTKIYEKYSQQKQANLINQALAKSLEEAETVDPEYKAMNEFIDPIKTKKDQLKEAINSCKCLEELEEISFEEIE